MADRELISKYRSEVIERTINVEWLINAIISQHYFKRVVRPFLLEVLYDEYFSFGLRRRILEKIVKDFDQRKLQDLNRVNRIRNYFAHCNQEFFEGAELPENSAEGKVIDPRRLDRAIDFEELHDEFAKIVGGLEQYLVSVCLSMGGELRSHSEGQ